MGSLPYHSKQPHIPPAADVLAYCESHSNAEAAHHFQINERSVRRIKQRANRQAKTDHDQRSAAPAGSSASTIQRSPSGDEQPAITPRHYVYVLAWPSGQPFYVGKGQGRRLFEHDNEALAGCECAKCHSIRTIWRMGGRVVRYIVFATHKEQEALAYERELIALYGRNTLTNKRDGG